MTLSPQRPDPTVPASASERLTIGEGRSLARIQRTVCWQRLECLHRCLPGQYREPAYLYLLLRREISGGSN